jgi:hypothetical protein
MFKTLYIVYCNYITIQYRQRLSSSEEQDEVIPPYTEENLL